MASDRDRRCGRRASTHIISDRGSQFQDDYRAWCKANGAKPRFGAIGKHGSIALTERTILSLKSECLWRILIPLRFEAMIAELGAYVLWFNEHRPHQALGGATPNEVFFGKIDARDGTRFETRKRFPLMALKLRRTRQRKRRAPRGAKLVLITGAVENRPQLPTGSSYSVFKEQGGQATRGKLHLCGEF